MDVDPLLKAIPSCPCFEGKARDAGRNLVI